MAIFGERSVWESKEVCGRHGCDTWKSILLGKRGISRNSLDSI